MPSDPVPLVIHIAHINDAAPQNARSEVYEREFVDRALAAKDETIAALQKDVDAARDLIRRDAVFQEWAQGYLNAGKWAGHDRSDAVKVELLERDAELAAVRQQLADAQQRLEE